MSSRNNHRFLNWVGKFIKNNPQKRNPTRPILDLVYHAAKELTVITLEKPLEYDEENNTLFVYITEMYNSSSSSLEGIYYSSYSYDKSTGILNIVPVDKLSNYNEPIILTLIFENVQPIRIVYNLLPPTMST